MISEHSSSLSMLSFNDGKLLEIDANSNVFSAFKTLGLSDNITADAEDVEGLFFKIERKGDFSVFLFENKKQNYYLMNAAHGSYYF